MKKLDKYMQNIGRGQFTYEVFKAAYDSDPRLQELVSDFDDDRIELKDKETDDLDVDNNTPDNDGKSVSQMAKSAVDLKDL